MKYDLAITYLSFEKIRNWYSSGKSVVLVSVENTKGSAPREKGAVMAVTTDAITGTIGGGQLEWLAMDQARKMIADTGKNFEMDVPLGPEIGQCCGGRVSLKFQFVNTTELENLEKIAVQSRRDLPDVFIFGAGHTGLALAALMARMPTHSVLVDTRAEALILADDAATTKHMAMPEMAVREAKPGSAFVTMTHEHSLDFLITAEALKRGDAAYCGMIGSATKRAVFLNWLDENGYDRLIAERLVCPIGGDQVRDKRPEIIAAMTMVEILTAIHTAAIGEIK